MVSARAMVKCGKVHHLRTRVYVTMDKGFLWNCPSVKETKKELPLMMVTFIFYLDPRYFTSIRGKISVITIAILYLV